MYGKKYKSIVSIVLCMMILVGCTNIDSKGNTEEKIETNTILPELPEERVFSYAVPKVAPRVLVDQVGYETKSKKVAVFLGENLKDTFEVIDAMSGETVYTGKIVFESYNEEIEEHVSHGSFTELDKNGTYYIQTPIIGQSYPFTIGENLYADLIPKMCKLFFYRRCGFDLEKTVAGEYAHKACHLNPIKMEEKEEPLDISGGWHTGEEGERDVTEGTTIIANLLLAFEMYQKEFTDDSGIVESGNQIPDILDEIRYEIEWLLKMQSAKTGGVFANTADFHISKEATANFVSATVGFYQIYKEYDASFAKNCLNAGIKAWNYLQRNEINDDCLREMYFAATQLYRATGELGYHNYINNYFKADELSMTGDSTRELYGDITYLMTRRKVDTVMCRTLMDKWMETAENIVYEAQSDEYMIAGDNNAEMFDNMFCLSLIGHIITNHEYGTILESHLHYLLGRNKKGVSYIEGIGTYHPEESDVQDFVTSQSQMTSILIFMLGEIGNEELEEEK